MNMKRCLPIVLATVVLGFAFGWLAAAQLTTPGYVVSDLQLISQESKTDWSAEWTGPIQAATILAWFAEHGYPALIRDFNNDGVIDELDTIELADILGKTVMGTETVRGTTDVRLVLGLARYVAERYPDQFELKIYDVGFSGEFATEEGDAFDPRIVDGIELVLKNEPSIAAYEAELESGEGVIVGLEEGDDGNTYLSGRSFLYETTPDGYTPIDLAWAKENRYEPGPQGKVLETVGKMDEFFYLDYHGHWTKAEFMLALSPSITTGEGIPGEDCPDLIVIGSAKCEFVEGETECDDEWSVTVEATVRNIGAADVSDPFHLWLTGLTCDDGTTILDPEMLLCGADIDQINATGSTTVHFTFSLPASESGPCCEYTLIVDSHAVIDESCYPAPWGEFNNAYHGTVCCDREPRACPDLTIGGIHSCRCWETDTGHICRVYIEATITNIAPGVPVSIPFVVGLLYGCTDGGGPHGIGKVISGARLAELNATGSMSVGFWYVFATTNPIPPCCKYVLVVDYWNAVDESCHPDPNGEHNNIFTSGFCCDEPPLDDGRCPDLTIFGMDTCTCRETPGGDLVCYVGIDAFVGKDGGPVSDPFEVRLTIDCADAFPSQEQWKMVAPGQINDGFEMVHFDYLFSPLDPMNPCCTYSLEVDQPDVIDETCFIGGEMNNSFGPVEFCCNGTTQDCPDLMVAVDEAICTCGPGSLRLVELTADACAVTVYGTVTNIGSVPILNPFDVAVDYGCADGMGDFLTYRIQGSQLAELNTTGSTTVEFTWLFTPLEEDFNCCHFVLIVDSGEEVDECVLFGEANNVAGGMVCCEIPTQECPDLTVTGSHSCSCIKTRRGYSCEVHVEATVTNISPEVSVTGSFGVALLSGCIPGGGGPIVLPISGPNLAELNETGSSNVEFFYEFATTDPTPPCCKYTLEVDFLGVIDESCHPDPNGEHNNLFVSTFCCEDTTPLCPDLIVEITVLTCRNIGAVAPLYEVTIEALVTNIGTETVTQAIYVEAECACGNDTDIIHTDLGPGESDTAEFVITCSPNQGGCHDVTVTVDYTLIINECDERNNTDEGTFCCR
jgi:hypothetical protein